MGFSLYYMLLLSLASVLDMHNNIVSAQTNVGSLGLVDSICHETRNASFCLENLGSLADSPTANLTIIAERVINITLPFAANARNIVYNLSMATTSTPELQSRYNSCLTSYTEMWNDLCNWVGSVFLFSIRDSQYLTTIASNATAKPVECDENFVTPPAEDYQLVGTSRDLQNMFSIILAISKRWPGAA